MAGPPGDEPTLVVDAGAAAAHSGSAPSEAGHDARAANAAAEDAPAADPPSADPGFGRWGEQPAGGGEHGEDVTDVLPRYGRPRPSSTRRSPHPTASPGPALTPGPASSQPSGPGRTPRRPRQSGQPSQPVDQSVPPAAGPLPTSAPMPPVGPPRRWPAEQQAPQPGFPARVPKGLVPTAPAAWGQLQLPGQPGSSARPTSSRRISPTPSPGGNDPITPVVSGSASSLSVGKKVSESLTLSKVLAGGMAAATSAIFGSYFGTFGTVGGAAVGSVATTVATNIYQRSLERTRELTVSRVRARTGRTGRPLPGESAEPIERQRTVRMEPGGTARSAGPSIARSLVMVAGGSLLIFLLGLTLVTGIEWAKGSPLSGGTSGTSVGHVFAPRSTPTPEPNISPGESSSGSEQPSSETPSSEQSSGGAVPSSDLFPSESSPPSPRLGPNQPNQPGPNQPGSQQPSRPGLLPSLGAPGLIQPNQ